MGRHGPGVLGAKKTSELISKGPIGLSQVNTERHHVGERTRIVKVPSRQADEVS